MTERGEGGRFLAGHRGIGGRPLGSAHKLGEQFKRDLSVAWEKHGAVAIDKVAATEPAKFLQIVASVLPKELMLAVEQRTPGNLSPGDMALMGDVLAAVRDAIPDASSRQPGDVLNHVLAALRLANAREILPAVENTVETQAHDA